MNNRRSQKEHNIADNSDGDYDISWQGVNESREENGNDTEPN